jgi:exopolysaccharide biosynthesis polyprenyl glycosylphosphotransferase
MRFIYRLKQITLAAGDLVGYFLALWLALTIRMVELATPSQITQNTVIFAPVYGFWLVINFISGIYDLGKAKNNQLGQFIQAGILATISGITLFYIFPNSNISPKTILILTALLGYGLSFGWHWLYKKYLADKTSSDKIIFIGYTPETKELLDILKNNPGLGYKTTALIDLEHKVDYTLTDINIYHNLSGINSIIKPQQTYRLIIANHLKNDASALRDLYHLMFQEVRITELSSFYEVITGRIPPYTFSESWFLDQVKNYDRPIYEKLRWLFDLLMSIILGLLFILLLPLIALAIKLSSPGPIFYKQTRVGRLGKEFFLYKFRSMQALSPDGSAEIAGAVFAQKNDARITTVGKILRQLRLDELPQIINLFKGEIALIGPRPERPEIVKQLEQQMPYYSLRHIIKPGLTGWAAVHQHYTDNLETSLQKLQYDLFYIKNRSILLDLSILLRTVNVVIRMMGQ